MNRAFRLKVACVALCCIGGTLFSCCAVAGADDLVSASSTGSTPFEAVGPNPLAVSYYKQRFSVSEATARARLELQTRPKDIATDLKAALGGDYTDAWFDNSAGQWVFDVTDSASASTVDEVAESDQLQAGEYRIEKVPYNFEELASADHQLHLSMAAPESAGDAVVGVGEGKIEVDVSTSASELAASQIAAAKAEVIPGGVQVVEHRETGNLKAVPDAISCTWPYCNTWVSGPRWYAGSESCSVGFYVTWPGSNPWWLTAGHCIISQPRQTPVETCEPGGTGCEDMAYTEVGYEGATYRGSGISDAGLLTNAIHAWPAYGGYINWHPGSEGAGLNTLSGYYSSSAPVGLTVCMNGGWNHESCGKINKTGLEEEYEGGIYVDNLIQEEGVCSVKGDSGGSVTSANETLAVGINVAATVEKRTEECPVYSYSSPVGEALSHWGLTLME